MPHLRKYSGLFVKKKSFTSKYNYKGYIVKNSLEILEERIYGLLLLQNKFTRKLL